MIDAPRGRKSWGLLAYLVRSRVAPSRERIAGLLFPDADDPLGALRWTLSTLRRQLSSDIEVGGDPVRMSLSHTTSVDVDVLSRGSWVQALALPGLGHEFLDGLVFSSPGFEMWLENERRSISGATAAVLRQAALAQLAQGDAAFATERASELVQLNPFDENAHALLARCLRATGDHAAADRQLAACEELFRRELGISPTTALREAGESRTVNVPARSNGRAATLAQIETGQAVIAAGATAAGLERLRQASVSARELDDSEVLARALIALGGALVHGARGTDVEGAAALHEGVHLAVRGGHTRLSATGWREIGWVQFLRAEYDRAEESMTTAASLAGGDDEELAWVDVILGTCRNDVGDYASAEPLLRSAVERSRRVSSAHPLAFSLSMLARLLFARGQIDDASELLDEALDVVDARGLIAFRPWPESFRAEIDLLRGDVDAAESRFEHAFAVGCEVGDPCWESIAARGLGLVAASRGDVARALEFLADAPRLCRRLPDTYVWIEAYGLDALCSVAIEHRADGVREWVDDLESITARRGMRELLLHAALYRVRLGEPGALDVARLLAAQIDNPAVRELVAAARPAPAAA